MKKLLEIGDLYAGKSNWKDFALVKLCLLALGVIIGINTPKEYKKTITVASLLVFIVTYIPLMSKLIKIATQGGQEE